MEYSAKDITIEVEKKVMVSSEQMNFLKEKAHFLGKVVYEDIYYDKSDKSFTLNNMWLRKRSGLFELKIGLKGKRESVDHYLELDNLKEIARKLDLPEVGFESELEKNGILPFASFTTCRESYELNGFNIVFDNVFAEGFSYSIAEIELLVNAKKEIKKAEKRILDFALSLGCDPFQKAKAKITAYLEIKNRAYYEALFKAGII